MAAHEDTTTRRGWLRTVGAGVAGAAGATVAAATPALAAGSTFFPITPYRSIDSRPGQPIQRGQEVDIDLITDQFGNGRLPAETLAVTYNLTVTQTAVNGFLTMWPADQAFPGTSSINWWQSGFNLANGGTVALGPSPFSGPGSVALRCNGATGCRTHVLIDVTGYYLAA
jgi:hypothetical protein